MKRELYTTINETNCNSWEFILPLLHVLFSTPKLKDGKNYFETLL